MNRRAVLAIAKKDLKAALRNKMVVLPMALLPLILLVALPLVAGAAGAAFGDQDIDALIASGPAADALAAFEQDEKATAFILLYMFAPMYLMLPLLTVHVLAADAIAGERERRTLEALVYTPTTDRELMLGKMLVAFVPALVLSWLGFVVYGVTANVAGWSVMERIFFPNATWLVLAFWVAPAVAGFGLGVMTIVSARAETFQGAYQTGGFVVLPIILLMIAQSTGVVLLGPWLAFVVGVVLWAATGALLWFGARSMRRSELLARMKG